MKKNVSVDLKLMIAILEEAVFNFQQNETGRSPETNDKSTSYAMGQIDAVAVLLNEEQGENESYYIFLNRLIEKYNLNVEKLNVFSNDSPLKFNS